MAPSAQNHRDFILASAREDFALKYGTKTWNVSPTGNPYSIVVSYPRPDGTVKVYDLDSGEFYWVELKQFTRTRVSGRNEQNNYGFSAVMTDDCRCESEDIEDMIGWESLKEYDAHPQSLVFNKQVKKLVSLPSRLRSS